MKATLESRKSVRINWFKQENVPFITKRKAEFSYDISTITRDERRVDAKMHHVFTGISKPVPASSIIVFTKEGLPQSYLHTTGSIGDKLSTDDVTDTSISIIDRLVKVEQGEEKITTKPVPAHESHRYKEIQVHERTDTITRKISLKNEGDRSVNGLELLYIQKKNLELIESKPAVTNSDPPEYTWLLDVPPEENVTVELVIKSHVKETYKIEHPKAPKEDRQAFIPQQVNAFQERALLDERET